MLDLMISKVFSNLVDCVILQFCDSAISSTVRAKQEEAPL